MDATMNVVTRAMAMAMALPVLIASCTGKIGDVPGSTGAASATGSAGGGGGAGPAGGGQGSAVGTGGSTPAPPPPTPDLVPRPEAAGPLPLRRLSTREFNNTVADLLGDTTRPALDFPADAPSENGYLAPIDISDLHAQRYDETAGKLADAAMAANRLTVPCTNPTAATEATCARQFIQQTGRRAFRRPVLATEETGLLAIFTQGRTLGLDFRTSLAQVVRAMLQSPGFIYHWEVGPNRPAVTAGVAPLTSHQVASRLSYFLWETMPDPELFAAADADSLLTPDAVEAQARRMLVSPRAKSMMESFHTHWLLIENLDNLQKNAARYPSYTPAFREALAPGISEFANSILGSDGDGTLKSLLTAPYGFVNAALAPAYGVTATGTALTRTALDATKRAGLLTQPTFLASRAGVSASNPIYRGLSVYKQLLCGAVRPVPGNIPDVEPEVAGKTTRDRYAAHAQGVCASCHAPFDPLGFAFENYDAVGAYRTTENGINVNATGTALTPRGKTINFANAIDLVNQLSESDEVKWCVTQNWFRFMMGRSEVDADWGSIELAYQQGAKTTGFSLREMVMTAVRSMAFRYRTVSPTEGI